MDKGLSVQLTAPDAELDVLSFAQSEPDAVSEWIGRLPMANTSDAASQIRQATFEIARLKTDWPERMALIEGIRPTLQYLAVRLDKTATSASNQGAAIARLAQRLQTNLCSGYKAVILGALDQAEDTDVLDTIALAIHRALSDLSRTLVRTLQFYVAPAERLWLELNQLYYLAERLNVDGYAFADPENKLPAETSVTDAYLRSILIALARPNQLRHRQLRSVFDALEGWSRFVSLTSGSAATGAADGNLYALDLLSDQGPQHVSQISESDQSRTYLRGVRMDLLNYELEAFLKDLDVTIRIPSQIDDYLIQHLVDAWGELQERAFRRAASTDPVKVCVGFRASHYFLSGGVEFADQLDDADVPLEKEINPFLKDNDVHFVRNVLEVKDVWDDAFDLRVKIPENPNIANPNSVLLNKVEPKPEEKKGAYHHYDTTTVDISPAGHRLRWNEPLPVNVVTGELVAMRDETDPRWCIAVIRWIRQDTMSTDMGIELLAPQATPVAARAVQKKGGPTKYTRGLMLAALKPIDQPATLILPLLPFETGQKIHFTEQGVQTTAQLGECLLKTESFNQFTFRVLDGYLENPGSHRNMGNLDQITGNQKAGPK
jgi:hypothetical protein